jgi:hypothetical protein
MVKHIVYVVCQKNLQLTINGFGLLELERLIYYMINMRVKFHFIIIILKIHILKYI